MENNNKINEQLKKFPPKWPFFLVELLGASFICFLTNKTVAFSTPNAKGAAIAKNALLGLLKPSMKLILDTSSVGLANMLLETLAIAFLGTVIGTILAIPLAFLCSKNVAPRWCNNICLVLISTIRAFPSFMYAIMFVKCVGTGPFAGVLTMAISSIGMVSKLLVDAIEELPHEVIEALDALGCNGFEKIRYGIIPQLFSNIASIVIYRLDINVKNATVLGLVGAGGIGASLIQAIGRNDWSSTSAMLLGLVVMVLILEYFSTKMRSKLVRGE